MTVRLSRVDPSQNMARFYEIDLQPTLFGEFSVQRHWGRIGTAGQSKSYWFSTEEIALNQAALLETSKRRRGYICPSLP